MGLPPDRACAARRRLKSQSAAIPNVTVRHGRRQSRRGGSAGRGRPCHPPRRHRSRPAWLRTSPRPCVRAYRDRAGNRGSAAAVPPCGFRQIDRFDPEVARFRQPSRPRRKHDDGRARQEVLPRCSCAHRPAQRHALVIDIHGSRHRKVDRQIDGDQDGQRFEDWAFAVVPTMLTRSG